MRRRDPYRIGDRVVLGAGTAYPGRVEPVSRLNRECHGDVISVDVMIDGRPHAYDLRDVRPAADNMSDTKEGT